jgi:hypothetical protein
MLSNIKECAMLYWLPRLCLFLLVGAVVGLGVLPATSDDIANTLIVVILGLGLFSLTLHVFPPERY